MHGWEMLALVELEAALSVRHRNCPEESECFWSWQVLKSGHGRICLGRGC